MSLAAETQWAYSLELATPPTVEPVGIEEARAQCEYFHNDSDLRILRLIRTARQLCETYLDRQFCTATWRLRADCFPWATETNPHGSLLLPKPPLISVTSIVYLDANGSSTTLSASDYTVQAPTRAQGKVHLDYGISWPSTLSQPNAVTVLYQAGYGAAVAVPDSIKDAILSLVAFLNEHRGDDAAEIPQFIKSLLDAQSWGTGL